MSQLSPTHILFRTLTKPKTLEPPNNLDTSWQSWTVMGGERRQSLLYNHAPLQVEPFASLAALPRFNVPRVLINREVVGPFKHQRKRPTDVAVTEDLVQSVKSLAEQAGWLQELEELISTGEKGGRGGRGGGGGGGGGISNGWSSPIAKSVSTGMFLQISHQCHITSWLKTQRLCKQLCTVYYV